MDATPHKMSTDCQIFINQMENCHCGPVSRQATHTGMENTATKISVTARDTTKQFVTLRNFRKATNARITSELPTRVRMMMMIRRKVEMNLIVKLNDWMSAATVVEMFRVVVAVPLAIFGCLKGQ